jgi:thiol-disulfide isomerase/thioredoxin
MTKNFKRVENRRKLRSWLIVLSVIAFVTLVGLLKNRIDMSQWMYTEPVTARLEQLRADGTPVVVYFHSPDCSSCEQVQASLNEVYPEFKDSVALLDLEVTNLRYRDLVNRVGVQTAPTLLLVNAAGEEKLIVGEISPQALRAELAALAGGVR